MTSSPSSELAGKNAVVTGASSGIGRAIALELAAAGANVVVHARKNLDGAAEVVREVAACNVAATVIAADFADAPQHESFVESCWQWRDGIDIWINNAGADVLTGAAAGWEFDAKLEHLWNVDVKSTIRLSRLIGAKMRQRSAERASAAIINVGWDQTAHGMAGASGEMFAATKGAIVAFTGSLARSLAPQVRVNCVAPGWIKTDWGEQASEYWQNRARKQSLLDRWGTPEDVARVVRFLVSPAASFVNGQTIAVNGGFRHDEFDAADKDES